MENCVVDWTPDDSLLVPEDENGAVEIEMLPADVDKLPVVCETVLDTPESEVVVSPLEVPDDSADVDRMDELDEPPRIIIT